MHNTEFHPACNASVNSSCAHPPPFLGNCGAFACPASPGGGALANLHDPRVGHLPTPRLLPHTWFPTQNPNMEDFISNDQQFVADWMDWTNFWRFSRFYEFLHCLSRHNHRFIYVNRRTHASLNKDLSKIWLR